MSTADQSHAAALHGEALLQAQRSELHALIAHLEALANGHDDTRVEVAGTIAGAWFASPATRQGHELIAAGLLLIAGPVDGDALLRAVRTGCEGRQTSMWPRAFARVPLLQVVGNERRERLPR